MPNSLIGNRLAKAERFADFLAEHLPSNATAFDVGNFTTEQWEQITLWMNELGGNETLPSYETRAYVQSLFRVRESRPDNVFDLFR